MIKCILLCKKCNQKTNSYDDGDGILEIDFSKQTIFFLCPKCGHQNVLMFNEIQKKLEKNTKLPRVGGIR